MTGAVRFLHSLAHLLSTGALYGAAHPAVRRGLEAGYTELKVLFEDGGPVVFSFIEDEAVFRDEPLRILKNWSWTRRFSEAGIQRLEVAAGVGREEFEGLLFDLTARLGVASNAYREASHPNIEFGMLGLQGTVTGSASAAEGAGTLPAGLTGETMADVLGVAAMPPPLSLQEESQAIEWIYKQVEERGDVPIAETAAVVRALSVVMHSFRDLIAPLTEMKFTDQYTTVHCINVAILSMSLAEYLKFKESEVRAIGEAALLHDVGRAKVPVAVTGKAGTLAPDEREIIEEHPIEGTRILLGGGIRHAVAAVVAYEHHMHYESDGGYPARTYPRKPHRFSRLVQVCDVYDALRTRRPFRPPLSSDAAIQFLTQRAGTEFDPEMVTAFADMMREWEPHTLARHVTPDAAATAAEVQEEEEMQPGDLASMPEVPFDADTESGSTGN